MLPCGPACSLLTNHSCRTLPTHPQAEAEQLRAELERYRTSLDGLKAAQNEYVQSAKKVQRAERKLADRQTGKVGNGGGAGRRSMGGGQAGAAGA